MSNQPLVKYIHWPRLTSLGQWEADWQMKFDVAKCHSMRVTQHQNHKQINSWLSVRSQQVVLDGQTSDPVPVLSVVLQRSVSPRSRPVPHLH